MINQIDCQNCQFLFLFFDKTQIANFNIINIVILIPHSTLINNFILINIL